MNEFEDTLHGIAKKRLEDEAEQVLSVNFGRPITPEAIELDVKIFGWSVARVYRDDKKNIIKIVLQKGNEFKSFVTEMTPPERDCQ